MSQIIDAMTGFGNWVKNNWKMVVILIIIVLVLIWAANRYGRTVLNKLHF